ncbi:protein kish-A-like [Trichosurus vulpecula]|uniref:protein kish-A-like n=1 Tax=Trichosurus vulpecula TaxID=9337 RepID=UPI00186B57B7|nr:protein kish-A-like [Trichosurus vulpecula]
MSAIFNFQSLPTAVVLLICTCPYIQFLALSLLVKNKTVLLAIFWKCARICERESLWGQLDVAVCYIAMAFSIVFLQ